MILIMIMTKETFILLAWSKERSVNLKPMLPRLRNHSNDWHSKTWRIYVVFEFSSMLIFYYALPGRNYPGHFCLSHFIWLLHWSNLCQILNIANINLFNVSKLTLNFQLSSNILSLLNKYLLPEQNMVS